MQPPILSLKEGCIIYGPPVLFSVGELLVFRGLER